MESHQNFLVGALVGSAVAAAAVLLMTPLRGSDVRHRLYNSVPFINGQKKAAIRRKVKSVAKSVRRKVAAHKKVHAVPKAHH